MAIVPARPTFTGIPQELRRIIYLAYLEQHYRVQSQQQPSNTHLLLLKTCRFVYKEAHDLLWRYLSLQTEEQILAFVTTVDNGHATLVEWADVACDNRVYRDPAETTTFSLHPVSQLHVALKKMSNLRQLRTFEPRILPMKRPGLKLYRFESEKALCYPSGSIPGLTKYELYRTSSGTGFTNLFRHLAASSLHTLRLSGICYVAGDPPSFEHLQELVVYRLACDEFPAGGLAQFFADAKLKSFVFVQAAPQLHNVGSNTVAASTDGMVLHDDMLDDIVRGPAKDIRELTLLGCRPGSVTLSGVASCLRKLPNLEYLALSYAKSTHDIASSSNEDQKRASISNDHDALLANLPLSLRTLKLLLPRSTAEQTMPSPTSESATFFDDLAKRIFIDRQLPHLQEVCVHVEGDPEDKGLQTRWKAMAEGGGVDISLVDWTGEEEARL